MPHWLSPAPLRVRVSQVRSTEVCKLLVRQLADHRIDFIHQRADTDEVWARNINELIGRTEAVAEANRC